MCSSLNILAITTADTTFVKLFYNKRAFISCFLFGATGKYCRINICYTRLFFYRLCMLVVVVLIIIVYIIVIIAVVIVIIYAITASHHHHHRRGTFLFVFLINSITVMTNLQNCCVDGKLIEGCRTIRRLSNGRPKLSVANKFSRIIDRRDKMCLIRYIVINHCSVIIFSQYADSESGWWNFTKVTRTLSRLALSNLASIFVIMMASPTVVVFSWTNH